MSENDVSITLPDGSKATAALIPINQPDKNGRIYSSDLAKELLSKLPENIDFSKQIDEVWLKIITVDDKLLYAKLHFSNNPPVDENNPGCIGIDIYDSHMRELDGGELDYTDNNINLKDMIDDCLEFMDIKYKEYSETKFLKLIN